MKTKELSAIEMEDQARKAFSHNIAITGPVLAQGPVSYETSHFGPNRPNMTKKVSFENQNMFQTEPKKENEEEKTSAKFLSEQDLMGQATDVFYTQLCNYYPDRQTLIEPLQQKF